MERQCAKCGAHQHGDSLYCVVCGASLKEDGAVVGTERPGTYTRRTFYRRFASTFTKASILALSAFCFFYAALALFPVSLGGYQYLLTFAVYLTFGCLLLFRQSRGVLIWLMIAAALTALADLFSLLVLYMGVMWVVAFLCLRRLRGLWKAYGQYEKSGVLPENRF